jgi:two-component system sensor histidine kinase BaeS
MPRTLRGRLILSHILPLLTAVVFMYVALTYLLETRFLLPKLANDLLSDARLLADLSQAQYMLPGGEENIPLLLLSLEINPQVRVAYLKPDGTLTYTNDASLLSQVGQKMTVSGMDRAQTGNEVLLTHTSYLSGAPYSIQVLIPVIKPDGGVGGVVWLTYYEASLTSLYQQMRLMSMIAILGSLLISALLGSWLAINIGKPVRQATEAINSLAHGERSEALAEQGPEEVRDLILAVNVLVARLHSLEQARRQLLANLVHELGRPLGALRSAIQALAKGAAGDPALLQDLTSGMDEETARLQFVLEELAHLHDQVLGSLELNRQPTAMSEWLGRVLLPWQQAAAEKRLHWQVEIPSDLPTMTVDALRLGQVVGNLASNAVKYTPPGGTVTVCAGREGHELWIRFSDTGPGIAPEEQEKIFQPFYRGDQGRRIKQGMGLGLSIARDLVTAHEGHIEVQSQPGTGSDFTIWLPI